MRWSLKTALMLNAILLACLPIMFVGFVSMKYLSASMEREASEKNLLLANAYASELDRIIDNAQNRLMSLARILEDGTLFPPEKVSDYLNSQVYGKDDLEIVYVLDLQGVVTHLAPYDPNIYGLDMSRQAYTVAAKAQQSAFWSRVFISPQTGESTLVLVVPFKGGMLIAHLSLSAVYEIIDSIQMAPGKYVAVVDNHGTTIAHHNQELVAQRSNLSNQFHIAEGLREHTGNFRYEFNGERRIGSIALVAKTHWVVSVSQTLDQTFEPIRDLQALLSAAIFIAVLIAIVVAVISLQRLLAPLQKLSLDAQKIAGGNYNIEISSAPYKEIDEFNENFRAMIKKVDMREASLEKSEARFRATFEQAAVGVAHVSLERKWLRVNQKLCEIVGYSRDEMLTLTFRDITHPDDLETDIEHVNRLRRGEAENYSMETRYIRKSGEPVWVNLTVAIIRKEHGEPDWFVFVVEDISHRRQAQEKIRQLHEFTDHLIQTANVMIIGLDAKGQVTQFNPAAENITGYRLTEIEGEDWFAIFTPREKYPEVHEAFSRLSTGGLPERFENPIITKNGEERFIAWANSEIRHQETVVGTISFGLDITEQKQSEQKINDYQQRLKALVSQLTIAEERERRRIAEELHDNVGQSLALSRIQIAAIQETIKDADSLKILHEISATLKKTIQDARHLMFELSSPLMNEIGLADAISSWLEEEIEKRQGIKTELVVKGETKRLDDDLRAILYRNIRELLTNVVKHGQVDKVKVLFEFTEKGLRIRVVDDGMGFNIASVMQKSNREAGFGLFSIEERMNDLGGSFEIASEPGKGCTATLCVPIGEGKND